NTLLNWKVENQEDFDRYEIEYSTSGSGNYSLIGTVYPDNRSSASFNFTHVNAIAGGTNGYYRLKMIDKNGRYKYSFIVPVRFEKGVGIDVRPTLLNRGETIRITLSGNSGNNCKIKLFDFTGRTLQEIISRGNNYLLLETGKLNAGTYLICITGEGADQSFKILVQ
ncbi:MAG: T9SS type A sorting domain-containing protein, partial [Chitinophagaceae bacterium]